MNNKNSISTLCLTLMSIFMFGCHLKGDLTIYEPVVEKNETSGILEISKIVLTDTATVFYFDAYHYSNPAGWFSIAERTVLQGSHRTYKLIACDGIELGKRINIPVKMPEVGYISFTLYFEPVDKSEKTVDFNDSDNDRSFSITGIKLYQTPKPTGVISCTLKGEVIDRLQSSRLILLKDGEYPNTGKRIYIPIHNGKFEYILNCDHEELYYLVFYDEIFSYRPVEFISEQGGLNFTLHPTEQYDMNIIEGGKLNKEYMDYKNKASYKHDELEPYQSVRTKFKQLTGDDFISISTRDLFDQVMREDTSYQEWLRWKLQYAKEHPTIVGYIILLSETRNGLKTINDFLPFADAYQTVFAPKHPNHPYTAKMIDLLTASSLKAGVPFIDFTVVDLTGQSVRLSERITGKSAVLHLWASWCGPCRQKGKELIPVYEEFRNKGFVVIGVARERGSSSAAETAVKLDKYPWENLVELNDVEQIWEKYGIGGAAGSDFLIDEKGIIVSVAPSIDEIRDFLKNR